MTGGCHPCRFKSELYSLHHRSVLTVKKYKSDTFRTAGDIELQRLPRSCKLAGIGAEYPAIGIVGGADYARTAAAVNGHARGSAIELGVEHIVLDLRQSEVAEFSDDEGRKRLAVLGRTAYTRHDPRCRR